MTVRFVVISRIRFRLHGSLTPISDVTEIPFITLRTDVPSLSQSSRKREYSSTARETDPGTHIEVLLGVDCVRRFYVWEQDKDDECVREAVFATRVHWSCNL